MDIKYPDGIAPELDIGIHGCIKRGIEGDPAFFQDWIFTECGNSKALPVTWIGCIVYSIVWKIVQLTGYVPMCLATVLRCIVFLETNQMRSLGFKKFKNLLFCLWFTAPLIDIESPDIVG